MVSKATPERREAYNARRRECRATHKEQHHRNWTKWKRSNRQKAKLALFELLGGKCVRCGFTDVRALQIDHIDPSKKTKRDQGRDHCVYPRRLKEVLSGSHNYQLLCANCNWIKRHENHEFGGGQIL